MEALSTSLRGTGRWLVELANPALAAGDAYAARACAGMPLVELDHAMVAVAGYAALVAYGVATRPAAKPKAAGAEAEKAADAAPRAASRGASGGKKSGGGFSAAAALAKLQKEPLMILMLLYNVAQVALCGYMMVEALRVAYANYFPRVICNAHSNTAASKLKDVLWLFYVSKVLDFADTFFIVVRGKWEQFSFLHIYHHFSSERARRARARAGTTTQWARGPLAPSLARSLLTNSLSLLSPASLSPVFLTYWLVANAAPDGDVYYTVVANSFVHFVSEYAERRAPRLCAWSPRASPHLASPLHAQCTSTTAARASA